MSFCINRTSFCRNLASDDRENHFFSYFCGMKKQKRFMLSLLTLLACALSYAQSQVIFGTVLDESGQTVIGASVKVKGTNVGTVTDFNGNYGFVRTSEKFPATAFVLNPPYSASGNGMVFVEKALSMMDKGYAAIIIQNSAGSGKAVEYNKKIQRTTKKWVNV